MSAVIDVSLYSQPAHSGFLLNALQSGWDVRLQLQACFWTSRRQCSTLIEGQHRPFMFLQVDLTADNTIKTWRIKVMLFSTSEHDEHLRVGRDWPDVEVQMSTTLSTSPPAPLPSLPLSVCAWGTFPIPSQYHSAPTLQRKLDSESFHALQLDERD